MDIPSAESSADENSAGEILSSGQPKPDSAANAGIRLVLVDDQEVILDGIQAMLRRHQRRVEVCGTARSIVEALSVVAEHRPDVALVDVRIRGDSGLDLCRELVKRHPALAVVFFTVYDDEHYLYQALRIGARGFLLKQATGAELVNHLERVHGGEIVIDPAMAGRVALSAARLQSGEFWPGAHVGLTQRESEVLELVVQGLSNRAIATKLVVGEETVKTHLSALYRKLEAKDRSQAVAVALREGLFR